MGLLVPTPETQRIVRLLNDQFDEKSSQSPTSLSNGFGDVRGVRINGKPLSDPTAQWGLIDLARALKLYPSTFNGTLPPNDNPSRRWELFLGTHLKNNHTSAGKSIHDVARDAIQEALVNQLATKFVRMTFDHVEDPRTTADAVVFDVQIKGRNDWLRHVTLFTTPNF